MVLVEGRVEEEGQEGTHEMEGLGGQGEEGEAEVGSREEKKMKLNYPSQ